MKNLSNKISQLEAFLENKGIKTITFDIDGTLYPMRKIEIAWWMAFLKAPLKAMRFLIIRKGWEKRRAGTSTLPVLQEDITFFEEFLSSLLSPRMVPPEIHSLMKRLSQNKIKIYFLSDHGTQVKLQKLGLLSYGTAINCLTETDELKPHPKISQLLLDKYSLNPVTHLHVGDRWTDEKQAQLMSSHFFFLET